MIHPAQFPLGKLRVRKLLQDGSEVITPFTALLEVYDYGVVSTGVQADEHLEWTPYLPIDVAVRDKVLSMYPNDQRFELPILLGLVIDGVGQELTEIEVEVVFDETPSITHAIRASLLRFWFLGVNRSLMPLLLWRDVEGLPVADSNAGYNRRFYWPLIQNPISEEERSRLPNICDRYHYRTDDRTELSEA